MEAGGWKTPPPRVSSRAKSPGLIGLKCGQNEMNQNEMKLRSKYFLYIQLDLSAKRSFAVSYNSVSYTWDCTVSKVNKVARPAWNFYFP